MNDSRIIREREARDRDWLLPVGAISALQWLLCWIVGAQVPALLSYTLLAYVVLALVAVGRFLWSLFKMARAGERHPLRRSWELIRASAPRIAAVAIGVQIAALGGAAFNSMKVALPSVVPFWADLPLSSMERMPFDLHPWEITHFILGWATPLIDLIYASWLPVAVIALYSVMAMKPSPRKTQAMLAQALTWLVVGIGGAYFFSSAGPIFYDRLYGGSTFAPLIETLQREGATVALRTSDMLWRAYSGASVDVGTGISAVPSLHVGIALWLALVLNHTWCRVAVWIYYGLIWLGSVHLGWHYLTDGLIGSVGAIAMWWVAGALLNVRSNLGRAHGDIALGHA